MQKLLAIACVAFGCVSSDVDLFSAEQAEEQQEWDGGPIDPNGEVVEIESTWNGCLDAGVCWGELDEHPQDPGDSGGYGSGGGGGSGDGQPPKKVCDQQDRDECYDCCDWNADRHDAWACNRMPKRTKPERDARRQCWEKLERDRKDCYKECPKVIISETVAS